MMLKEADRSKARALGYRREIGENYCVSVWGGREQTSGGGGVF